MTLQVGDKVRALRDGEYGDIKKGKIGTVMSLDDAEEGDHNIYVDNNDNSDYFNEDELAKVTGNQKATPVHFLLKYDLDEDPIEEFETMKEVNDRIKELAQRSDLKRDSMVVYEIKSKKVVKLDTRISLKTA